MRLADGDQLFRILIRKGTQQHCANAAEDRHVYANAERQAQHGRDGESGTLGESPDGETDVLEHWRACRERRGSRLGAPTARAKQKGEQQPDPTVDGRRRLECPRLSNVESRVSRFEIRAATSE